MAILSSAPRLGQHPVFHGSTCDLPNAAMAHLRQEIGRLHLWGRIMRHVHKYKAHKEMSRLK